jgi:thioesterase domain-containing protein/glycosyltransferase involved in cell wall biosynthesis
MKILLTMNLPYLLPHSGAIKANRLLAEGLAAKGHDVCVVVPAVQPVLGVVSRQTVDEFIAGLKQKQIAFQRDEKAVLFTVERVKIHAVIEPSQLRAQLENLMDRWNPDRVLVSCEDPSQNLLSAALKRLPQAVVYLVNTPTFLPFGPQSFYPSETRTELVRRVPFIVAGSKFVAEYILKWSGLPSTHFYWQVYGPGPFPDLSSFDHGFVSMINPCQVKGISIFVALARENPDLKFAAVLSWGSTAEDEQLLASHKNIQLLPASPVFEDILSKSRVLVVPSLWQESFGLAVVQAMLHGIPVLASNVGGLGEAKLGTDFLFNVHSIEGFGEVLDENRLPKPIVPSQDVLPWSLALRRLASDRDFYREHSRKAREAAMRFVQGLNYDSFERFLQLPVPQPVRIGLETGNSESEGSRDGAADGHEEKLSRLIRDLTPEQQTIMMRRLKTRQKTSLPQNGLTAGNSPTKWNPLLAIQPRGHHAPVFMVHAFTGRAEFYGNLAKYLSPEQPLFALHAPDLYQIDAPEIEYPDIETMAADYVSAIQKVQKIGPYFIGGYSYGSGIAFAMAKQLEQTGCEVAFVGILDSDPFQKFSGDEDDSSIVILRIRDLENQARTRTPTSFEELEKYQNDERLEYIFRQVSRSLALPSNLNVQAMKKMIRRFRQRQMYLSQYQPKPFAGQVTLFLTKRAADLQATIIEDWTRFSGQIVIEEIPGDHDNLIREPHVAQVGKIFDCQLKQARSRLNQAQLAK